MTPWTIAHQEFHGILQARILGCVAIPLSRGSSWPTDLTQVSWITGRFFTIWPIRVKAWNPPPLIWPKMSYIIWPVFPLCNTLFFYFNHIGLLDHICLKWYSSRWLSCPYSCLIHLFQKSCEASPIHCV